MVRPGISGWAQVNGGKLLSAQEKNELDEWYIRNASFLLDMRIIVLTLQVILLGERRLDRAARLGGAQSRSNVALRPAKTGGGSPGTTASG